MQSDMQCRYRSGTAASSNAFSTCYYLRLPAQGCVGWLCITPAACVVSEIRDYAGIPTFIQTFMHLPSPCFSSEDKQIIVAFTWLGSQILYQVHPA